MFLDESAEGVTSKHLSKKYTFEPGPTCISQSYTPTEKMDVMDGWIADNYALLVSAFDKNCSFLTYCQTIYLCFDKK